MKYKAIFLKKYGQNNYRKIGEREYDEKDITVTLKGKKSTENITVPIPKLCDTYQTGKESFIFINADSREIITFTKTDLGIDFRMLDKLISQDIIGKLISRIKAGMQEQSGKWQFAIPLIFLAIGVLLGYLIGKGGV